MSLLNKTGWFPIISGIALILFWILFALFLPMNEAYVNWVLDSDWVWINSIGFFGSTMGIFALYSIYSYGSPQNQLDKIGVIIGVAGIVLLSSLLFFEAYVLSILATIQPSIVNLNGELYTNPSFKAVSSLGGILLSIGVLFLSPGLFQQRTLNTWKIILLVISTPMFSLLFLPGNLRLLGVVLYSISLISLGIEINNQKKK